MFITAVYQIYKEVYHLWQKLNSKKPIVDEIANSIKDAQAVVLVNYSGPYGGTGYHHA